MRGLDNSGSPIHTRRENTAQPDHAFTAIHTNNECNIHAMYTRGKLQEQQDTQPMSE